MKKRILRKISFVLAFSIIVLTTGCSSHGDNGVNAQEEVRLVTPSPTLNDNAELKQNAVTPAIEPAATKELLIYTLNGDTNQVESKDALVSKDTEVTPELIVELAIDSLADVQINVDVNTVTIQGGSVIVSFNPDSLPVIAQDKETETAILDVIAQSLVDNFKNEYPKVIFRILDKEYSSKNYNFGLNEVYLDGTQMK